MKGERDGQYVLMLFFMAFWGVCLYEEPILFCEAIRIANKISVINAVFGDIVTG
jgi:hypothetical protein